MSNQEYKERDTTASKSEINKNENAKDLPVSDAMSAVSAVKSDDGSPMKEAEFSKELKVLRKKLKANFKLVEKESRKEFKSIETARKQALSKLPDSVSQKEVNEFEQEWAAVEEKALKEAVGRSEDYADAYNDEVKALYKRAGRAEPDLSSTTVTKIDEEAVKGVKGKTDDLAVMLGYLTFFLITPLGMVVFEDYAAAGGLLVLGGTLSMPAIANFVIKKVSWIYPVSVVLLAQLFVLSGLFKLVTSIGA